MTKIRKKIKKLIISNKTLSCIIRPFYMLRYHKYGFDSDEYWESRYKSGENSGAGSYGRLAKFKAKIINNFVSNNNINFAIELGCGDGNQLSLFNIPRYIGLDVSKYSIKLCQKIFAKDKSKSFFLYRPGLLVNSYVNSKSDLSLSLDVIFHLVEDEIYRKYMKNLFSSSNKYIIIYSSNTDTQDVIQPQHIKHRKFTNWVSQNANKWKLIEKIKNDFPLLKDVNEESISDF